VTLVAFADRIASHRGLRSLFFLTAALVSILLIGYHFGTFDQIVHIPFLKATADPSLYPGDAFVALRDPPISYFWFVFIPFYRLGILEGAIFAAHVLATTLTFTAIWRLSQTLFGDAVASTLAVIAFIFPHFGFLGFPVIEFSLLNRTFVLPFLLFAIDLYLNRRYGWAFLLLGLSANLHPLSAGMVTTMLLIPTLVEGRRIGFLRSFLTAATFLMGAAPILLLWFSNHQPVDWSLRPEWLSIIARGVLTQVLYPFAAIPFVLLLTLSGFSAVGLLLIARHKAPVLAVERPVSLMLITAGVIFAVGMFSAQFLPITMLVEMQLIRVSLFIFIFAYLYFSSYLAREFRAQSIHPSRFALLTGTFIANPLAIFPLAFWGLLRWLKPRRLSWGVVAGSVAGMFGLCVTIAISLGIWHPGIHIFAPQTDWVDAQEWARQNAPRNAVFITPPEKGSLYEPEWRVFSERSSVVSIYDIFEIALRPDYLDTWLERFELLAPGAEQLFNGNYFETKALTSQAFYTLTNQELLQAARSFEAGYLVVEKPHRRDFPLLYENEGYIIYQLP
jgi:hypothetical protein